MPLFKQILIRDDFMFGLDQEGRIWVVQINQWGMPNGDWKPFQKLGA